MKLIVFVTEQPGHSLPVQKLVVASKSEAPTESAHCFALSDIEVATKRFEKKIGSGGFGVVYYGKLKDDREIAVKVLTSNSYQGKREFSNEVYSSYYWQNLFPLINLWPFTKDCS